MRRTLVTATLTMILAACTSSGATSSPTTTRPETTTTTSTTTTTLPPTTTTVPPTTTTRPPNTITVPTTLPHATGTPCPAEIVAAVHRHFDQFGIDVAEWMVGIVWRESNCRPDVISPGRCYGLTQTALPLHADLYAALGVAWESTWMNPDTNLAAAALLYASSGSAPWRL